MLSAVSDVDANEPLLIVNKKRYSLLPIQYSDVFAMYKKASALIWFVEEVDLKSNRQNWEELSSGDQNFIKHVLAFFYSSDSIVMENLGLRFFKEVQMPEARLFYSVQLAVESIHSKQYALLLKTYIKDEEEKARLINAIETVPCIQRKAAWALKWIEGGERFAERLVAFAAVEGIFFSASFCAIFWLKKRSAAASNPIQLDGLTFSDQLISRDEALHQEFACLLYGLLTHKLEDARVTTIIKEAVDIEKEFVRDALPVRLIGINADLMCEYVEYVADRLLMDLGCPKAYDARCPFDWMSLISMQTKTNYFEKRVPDYQRAGVMSSIDQTPERGPDEDIFDGDF
jgi:ribonucleoside-diphosphate reductase subunit M2